MNKHRQRLLSMARIAVAVALITVGAWIKIPLGISPVPVALQCTMCVLCGLLLGPKEGTIAVAVYLALGLMGVPIFTLGGGITYVLQPTFGYLLSYLVAVPVGAVVARGRQGNTSPRPGRLLLGVVTMLAIVYTVGVWYMLGIVRLYMGGSLSVGRAWLSGCVIFVPTDCVLGSAAAMVAYKVLPILGKRKVIGMQTAEGVTQ